jgi:chlorite dismutase
MSEGHQQAPHPPIDVWERSHVAEQAMNRRLFMQLLVYQSASGGEAERAISRLSQELATRGAGAVLYQDVNHPAGLAILSYCEDPSEFVTRIRPAIGAADEGLSLRTDFTMLGRTYATGYEPDLEYFLLRRPVETVCNEDWPWAVWYPLRRSGAFARLEPREQGGILREHATIGKEYGAQDLAHDVRLACHGLDERDNEFVIGLVGKELHPLSHVVQAMRRTRQTAEFISQMGPFFVGRAVARSERKP